MIGAMVLVMHAALVLLRSRVLDGSGVDLQISFLSESQHLVRRFRISNTLRCAFPSSRRLSLACYGDKAVRVVVRNNLIGASIGKVDDSIQTSKHCAPMGPRIPSCSNDVETLNSGADYIGEG